MKNFVRNNKTTSFVLLSYLISWMCWLPVLNLIEPDVFSSPLYVIVLLLLGGYSPSLSAVIVCSLAGGREPVRNLLQKFLIMRVKLKWYLVALLSGPVFIFLALMLYISMGGDPGWVNYQVFLWLPVFFLIASLFGPLGEELGWRGLLLPEILKNHHYFSASVIVAIIWTFWHTPLFWASEGTAISGMPVTLLTVGKYLIFVSGTSLIYTWVFKNTRGSVFLAFLIHMSSNGSHMALNYLLPNMADKKAIWNLEVWVMGSLIVITGLMILAKQLSAKKTIPHLYKH